MATRLLGFGNQMGARVADNLLSYPRNGGGAPASLTSPSSSRKWTLDLVGGKFSVKNYPYMGVKWKDPMPAADTHPGAEAHLVGSPLPFPPAAKDPGLPDYLNDVMDTFSGAVTGKTYPPGSIVCRIVGDEAYPVSKHWTVIRYTDEATMRRDLALLCEWNGDKSIEVLEIAAPLEGHVGLAASQYINGPSSGYILRGGGEQIVFDPKRIVKMLNAGLASIKVEPL